MAITIDNNYKLSDEALVRVITPVCIQETGYSDPIKAARMVEYDIGDGAGWNYGAGSFTTRAGGMNAFMPFLKSYYPNLYSKLANDSKWETQAFKKSWQALADGPNGMNFYYAQTQFLWFYDGVTAIKKLQNKGFSIKLDGSRLEMVGSLLSIIHNQNPSWIYTTNPKYSWHNVVYRAFQKYPNDSGVKIITYVCDYISNNYSGTLSSGVRAGWARNKTRLLKLTNPLKNSSSNSTPSEPEPTPPDNPDPPSPPDEPTPPNEPGDNLPITTYKQTIKARDGIPSKAYIGAGSSILPEYVEYQGLTETTKYPTTVNFCYIDFTDNADDTKTLVNTLLNKYYDKPIFIARTANTTINTALKQFADETENVFFIDVGVYAKPTTTTAINNYYDKIIEVIGKTPIGYIEDNTIPDEPEPTPPSEPEPTPPDNPGDEPDPIPPNPPKPPEPTPPEATYPTIKEQLKANGNKSYGKVSGIAVTLTSKSDKSFYSRYSFETVSSIKYTQDAKVYLSGDDVTKGQLVPKPNSKYNIIVLYNPDKSKNGGLMYYGVVTKVKTGAYEDFKDSKLRKDTYSILNTYEKNSNKMLYHNGTTCMSSKNPNSIKDKWINPNTSPGDPKRYYIDCSTLAKLFLMGLTWSKSPYVKKTTNTVRNTEYPWSFNYNEVPRTAAEQAEWCVKSGYTLYGVDTTNYSNLEEGDLIFYDRDSQDNGRFMNISHVAIVYKIVNGVPYTIEATNASGTQSIRVMPVKDNTANKALLFARVKKY